MKLLFVFAICLTYVACQLRPGGQHVCQKSVAYHTYESRKRYRVGYTNYRTTKGLFGWWRKSVSRSYTVGYYTRDLVTRYRNTYICCNGWSRKSGSNECPVAICSRGCGHGRCTSPNKCTCHNGYYGTLCQQDIDECKSLNPCNQICTNLPGSYSCSCRKGYTKTHPKNQIDRSCSDINECSLRPCTCNNIQSTCMASCTNTIGSFHCSCNNGYHLSDAKAVCIDIDECSSSSLNTCHHHCYNTPGSYSCYCQTGFKLSNKTNKCTDIDECKSFNGGCDHNCTNQIGSFQCSCRRGYQLSYDKKTCIDINECKTQPPCDLQNGICRNFPGTYQCFCKTGYRMLPNNKMCEDINECNTTVGICQHKCLNNQGSYSCMCDVGYRLNDDKHTCDDIDECKEENHSCEHICHNVVGSYKCTCRAGYKLDQDGATCSALPCIRITHPMFGKINCTGFVTDARCNISCLNGFDLRGSTVRTCLPGAAWSGQKTICKRKKCPILFTPTHGSVVIPCLQVFGTTCMKQCSDGYYLEGNRTTVCVANESNVVYWNNDDAKCRAITPCKPNPCFHNGECIKLSISEYRCICEGTGYTGQRCEIILINVSNFPPLFVGVESDLISVTGYSDNLLKISPKENTGMLHFKPSSITLKYPMVSSHFQVEAKSPGTYNVTYDILNQGEVHYQSLPGSVVYVFVDTIPKPVLLLHQPFSRGCQHHQLDSTIILSSNCQWKKDSTGGFVSVSGPTIKNIPLSINGITRESYSRFISDGILEPDLEIRQFLEHQNLSPCSTGCNDTFVDQDTLSFVLNNLYFPTFVFNELSNRLPNWLMVSSIMESEKYNSANLHTKIVRAVNLNTYPLCNQLNVTNDMASSFAVYIPRMPILFQFQSSAHIVSEMTSTCFYLNLDNGYIGINVARGFDFSTDFAVFGIPVKSFIVSTLLFVPSKHAVKKCVVTAERKTFCVNSSLVMKSNVIYEFQHGKFTLNGNMFLQMDDKLLLRKLDIPLKCIFHGSLQYHIKLKFLGKSLTIKGYDKNTNGLANFADPTSKTASNGRMILNPLLSPDSFTYGYSSITFYPLKDSFVCISILSYGGEVIGIENINKISLQLRLYSTYLSQVTALLETKLNVNYTKMGSIFSLLRNSSLKSFTLLIDKIQKTKSAYEDINKHFQILKDDLIDMRSFISTLKMWLKFKGDYEIDEKISNIEKYIDLTKKIEIIPRSTPVKFSEQSLSVFYTGKLCLYNLCLDGMLIELKDVFQDEYIQLSGTFVEDKNITKRLRVSKGDVLRLTIDKNNHLFHGHMNVSIKIFDDFHKTTLSLTETSVSYNATVPLDSEYTFHISSESDIQTILSWKRIIRNVKGKSMEMGGYIRDLLQKTYEEISKYANTRLNRSAQRFSQTKKKFQLATLYLNFTQMQIKNVSRNYQLVYQVHEQAVFQLNNSQQQMMKYAHIQAFVDKTLSAICPIHVCEKFCVKIPVCDICQTSVDRNVNFLKCDQQEEKVSTVIEKTCSTTCPLTRYLFKPYYTGTCRQDPREQQVIDFALKKVIQFAAQKVGTLIGSIFSPAGSVIGGIVGKAVGYVISMFVSCSRSYEVETVKIPYTEPCDRPCTSTEVLIRKISNCYYEQTQVRGVTNETKQCRCVDSCVSKISNMSCIVSNTNCMKKRAETLRKLSDIPQNYTDLHDIIERKEIEVESLKIKLQQLSHQMNFSKTEWKKANILRSNAKHEQDMVLQADLSARNILSKELCVMIMFERNSNISNALKLSDTVKFDATLPLIDNMFLSVDVVNDLYGRSTKFDFLYTFDDAAHSVETAMRKLLFESCRNTRERRSLNEQSFGSLENNYMKFWYGDDDISNPTQKACLTFMHTTEFLKYTFSSLQNLTKDAIELENMVSETQLSLNNNIKPSDSSKNDIIKAEYEMVSLLQYQTTLHKNKTSVPYVLSQWMENMELYRHSHNISFCLGFVDCIIDITNDLKNSLSLFNHKQLVGMIMAKLINDVEELVETAHPNSLGLLLNKTNNLIGNVDFILSNSFHCLSPPKLTSPDKIYYDIEVGTGITLFCGTVQSKLPVSYAWKRSGKLIDEERSSKLSFTAKLSDKGNYVCEVTSKVGQASSNATYVNVYERPSLDEDLDDIVIYAPNVNNLSSIFVCNVTADPSPSYKWYYQGFDMLEDPVELSETSFVHAITDATVNRSGYYYCKASNRFGEVNSSYARFDVLEIEYPKFLLTIDVDVSSVVIANQTFDENFINSSFFDPVIENMNLFKSQKLEVNYTSAHLTIFVASIPTQINSNMTMEDILDHNVKSRQELSASAAVFLREISNDSYLTINANHSYIGIIEDTLSVHATLNICRNGYKIHDNGIICVQCPAGTYGNNQSVCITCDDGYYQDFPGQTYCNKCYMNITEIKKDRLSKHYCKVHEQNNIGKATTSDTWKMVGIVTGCVVVFFLVILMSCCLRKRLKRHQKIRSVKKHTTCDYFNPLYIATTDLGLELEDKKETLAFKNKTFQLADTCSADESGDSESDSGENSYKYDVESRNDIHDGREEQQCEKAVIKTDDDYKFNADENKKGEKAVNEIDDTDDDFKDDGTDYPLVTSIALSDDSISENDAKVGNLNLKNDEQEDLWVACNVKGDVITADKINVAIVKSQDD